MPIPNSTLPRPARYARAILGCFAAVGLTACLQPLPDKDELSEFETDANPGTAADMDDVGAKPDASADRGDGGSTDPPGTDTGGVPGPDTGGDGLDDGPATFFGDDGMSTTSTTSERPPSTTSTGGPQCGDNVAEGDEPCDGSDLSGHTCQSLGFGGGVLSCRFDCSGMDTNGCGTASGTCCDTQPTAGCSVASIEACVCALDGYCCDTQWDSQCVSTASASCSAVCS